MAIDVTTLIVLLLFFLKGYSRGLIVAVFSVLALLLGVVCSLTLAQLLATWMLERGYTTAAWAPTLSYVLLFTLVVIGVRYLAKVIQKMVETLLLGQVNRIAGGLLYAFAGAVAISSLLWLMNSMGALDEKLKTESHVYPFTAELAPWFFSVIGVALPFAKVVFTRLQQFFDAIKGNLQHQ